MFKPITYPNIDIQCPVCKQITNIQAGRAIKWRLDCLNCCQTPGVKVVITEFIRVEDGREHFTNFATIDCKMHVQLPNDKNFYVWKFDYRNKKTTIYRVDREAINQNVHVFDSIIDINLNNFVSKTKMCLIFG